MLRQDPSTYGPVGTNGLTAFTLARRLQRSSLFSCTIPALYAVCVLLLLDVQIHRLIYKAASNKHLEETLVRLDNLVTRIWCLVIDQMPPIAEHLKEHSALLRAILDGDADLAAELVTAHVTHFEQALRSAP